MHLGWSFHGIILHGRALADGGLHELGLCTSSIFCIFWPCFGSHFRPGWALHDFQRGKAQNLYSNCYVEEYQR
jgi:hypothetical protein